MPIDAPMPSTITFPKDNYDALQACEWSDDALARHVVKTVSHPRATPSDSFLLHSPLEVLARHRLLRYVDPGRRETARVRLLGVATQTDAYNATSGDAATQTIEPGTEKELITALALAIQARDLPAVDRIGNALGQRLDPRSAATALTDLIAAFTSAAGHAPIFLNLALRSALGTSSLPMLRPLLNTLAQFPDWRIGWIDDQGPKTETPGLANVPSTNGDLARPVLGEPVKRRSNVFDALAATPQLGEPGSTFIYPVMSQVDPEPATSLVGPVDLSSTNHARRSITRAAALSMLIESTDHAPYGWTHCLTMPQAVCHLAPYSTDVPRLLAIASTHVIGFRAAFAALPLPANYKPAATVGGWRAALDQDPEVAAAAVWHTTDSDTDLIGELASRAATHHDTHLVKYTLACIDETASDPASGRLYLAAAAKLITWWSQHDRH